MLRNKGFTLLELMIVLAILGLLITALVPAYSNQIQRGRDVSRAVDIDDISKRVTLYFSENNRFPSADAAGCVNETQLASYLEGILIRDPQTSNYNGCNTLGKYGYGMSTGILTDPNVFALIAIMEQPFGGNYTGSLAGFTGTLSAAAYNSGLTLTVKGTGKNYVRVF